MRQSEEKMETGPRGERAEDLDTARLVARFQAGDREAFTTIYTRYFDRVFAYLKVVLKDYHEAEDTAQQVFVKVLEALPAYEQRGKPFRSWLFTVVRNYGLMHLRKHERVDVMDPQEMNARLELDQPSEEELRVLGWLSDVDLVTFVERLPLPQRQVLLLRYLLGLTTAEIAVTLDRSQADVRVLQHRSIVFLRDRLKSLGRGPIEPGEADMRRVAQEAGVLRLRRFALH